MKPNSTWAMAVTGLMLTAGLVVAGCRLADQHPMQHFASLTTLVNCSGGFEAQTAGTEQQHIRQYSACLDRSTVESVRSASRCSGGDCSTAPAQERDHAQSAPDDRRWRL